MLIFKICFGVILSYFLGSIPTAFLFAKHFTGSDIRKFGSGNVGATNAMRMMGKFRGALVLLLDMFKGLIAVTLLASLLVKNTPFQLEIMQGIFGLAVVLGHIFSIFLNFNGGKGVATSAGVLLGIAPAALFFAAAIFFIITLMTKYVSLGSIVTSFFVPFFLLSSGAHYSYTILSALLCIIIVFKHKSNIKRLLSGREGKVSGKK